MCYTAGLHGKLDNFNHASYRSHCHMSIVLLEEIKFWHKHIRALNGYSIRSNLLSHVSLYTDASKLGFGGHSPSFENNVAGEIFNEQLKGTSSAERVNNNSSCTLQSCKKVSVFRQPRCL